MHVGSGRTVRAAGAAALAVSAAVALGVAPASAASVTYDISTGQYGPARPRYESAVARTRPEADRRCVAEFGFRARGADPVRLFAAVADEPDETEWFVKWTCTSN
ncbi:hypothetical protein UK23_34770 [Lentzea aerocolonigenes]|uniref:Secreted protein n=1 Tax=Lentzea aerocolonigenes TaxID=68170 RepID=A0A0F0GHL9_LENAE|nr:hypothetical protein [Lentzea aerocolonigenes]KJK43014.1 hypothetical protein UK23_34770 [Lentzea aerocolonigenes]